MGYITCCVLIALYVLKFGLYRFDDNSNGSYWAPIFKFVHGANSKHDRIKRILCATIQCDVTLKEQTEIDPQKEIMSISNIDDEISESLIHRKRFKQWLHENSMNGFNDIKSFKELQSYIHRESFLLQITLSDNKMSVFERNCLWIESFLEYTLSHITLPLYLCGRLIHLLFPLIIYIINLFIFGINNIPLLHHVLMISFICLLIIVIFIGYKVIYFTYCIYHIGYWSHPAPLNKSMINQVENAYIDMVQLPVIIQIFDHEFGEDVCKLIREYLKSIILS